MKGIVLAFFAIGASMGGSRIAHAMVLPTCTAATTTAGGVSSTEYFCSDGTVYMNQLPAGYTLTVGGGGEGGGTPPGGRLNPIDLKNYPAPGDCSAESAEGEANVAFKAYWEVKLKPRVAPDGKFYKIYFSDGNSQLYLWNNIISSTLAISPADNSTCKSS